MGYTQSWYTKNNLDLDKFRKFLNDCEDIIIYCEKELKIMLDGCGSPRPEIEADSIRFNGAGNGGETFIIHAAPPFERNLQGWFYNGYKTGRAPYDVAVMACLIALKHHFPEETLIKSDGTAETWQEAQKICFRLFGYGSEFRLYREVNPPLNHDYLNKKFIEEEEAEKKHIAELKKNPEGLIIIKESEKFNSRVTAAKNIRKQLKNRFPGVKFSVTSESYSGGDAVRINWTDGPTTEQVDEITNKYQYGYFDGMTDSYEYTGGAWVNLFGSAKFIQTSRSTSDLLRFWVAQCLGLKLNSDSCLEFDAENFDYNRTRFNTALFNIDLLDPATLKNFEHWKNTGQSLPKKKQTIKEAMIKAVKENDAVTAGKVADFLRLKIGYDYNKVQQAFIKVGGCTPESFEQLMIESDSQGNRDPILI